MTAYVVDASVAVKRLVSEAFSEEAVSLLDNRTTLIAPELLFAEAANALWALCRRGDIAREDFAEAVEALKAAPIGVPHPMRQLAASAARLAIDLGHPAYDCFYSRSRFRSNIPSSPPTAVSTTSSASIRICRTGLCMWRA